MALVENTPSDKQNLTKAASKSVFWAMTGNMGVSAVRFLGTMVLARILAPEEFGIIGMATLFTGFVALFGKFGIATALIQRNDIDDEYMNTGFWTSLGAAVFLCALSISASSFAADFFGQPGLRYVVIALSFNFIISCFGITQYVILVKEADFRSVAKIEIISAILRVLVIMILGLNGFGYWSIVIGVVVDRCIKSALLMMKVRWIPSLCFNREKFFILFRFGRNIFGQSIVNYFRGNMDFLVTGRVLGASELAYYQFAFGLPQLVLSNISQSVGMAIYPIYCKVQDDSLRLYSGYLKSTKLLGITTFPILGGLAFVADDFILTAYGSNWISAILPLRLLCVSAALRSVFSINGSILNSVGRPDISFKWSLFVFPIMVVAIIFGSRWGIDGIALFMAITSFLGFGLVYITLRQIDGNIIAYLINLLPAFLGTAVMVLALYLVNSLDFIQNTYYVIRLFFNTILGGLVYIGVIMFAFRESFDELQKIITMMLRKDK